LGLLNNLCYLTLFSGRLKSIPAFSDGLLFAYHQTPGKRAAKSYTNPAKSCLNKRHKF
jgi:hypothetical protein